ncbi:GH32 C-terminal domain-containing protein, partial [Paenibacillus odorifer]
IEAEVEIPAGSQVSEFGFNVRVGGSQKTVVGYKPGEGRIFVDRSASGLTDFSSLFNTRHEAAMQTENKRVKLRILVDESSIEVFGNNGKVVFSDVIFPDPASRALSFYTKGGNVKVVSLKVNQLGSVWNQETGSATKIMMDTSDRELSKGQSDILLAMVENGTGNGAQPLKWNSSNKDVVELNVVDK